MTFYEMSPMFIVAISNTLTIKLFVAVNMARELWSMIERCKNPRGDAICYSDARTVCTVIGIAIPTIRLVMLAREINLCRSR